MKNRRKFLKQSIISAGAFLSASANASACANHFLSAKNFEHMLQLSPYQKEIGLQLYTVRNQLKEDFEGTLKAIKKAGYFQIEGGNLEEIKKAKPIADDLGLTIRSSFFQWPFVTGRWDLAMASGLEKPNYSMEGLIDGMAEQGVNYLIFGYLLPGERGTIDEYKKYADNANKMGELCNKSGIKLCYHNHAFEYEPINGTVPYDVLIERFDNDAIRFELDVFWADLAGVDPVKLMKRLDGRIRILHLKDKLAGTPVIYNEQVVPKTAFKELGNGTVKLKKIIKLAEKIGVEQCMVEQDQSPDPIKSIQTSIQYMNQL